MKKLISVFVFGLLVAALNAQATDSSEEAAPAKCASSCESSSASSCEASTCESDCACPIGKAMAALPKMTYKVGEESTCCSSSAAALAKEHDAPIHFVVAKKEFDSKDKAMVELAAVTTKFVDDFATPHTCETSGKTSVCGESMSCSVSAGKMASVAKEAMKTVSMKFKVGDEECGCPTKAAELAKTSGAKKEYVIGEATTCCSVDAQIKLAHAKYRAAVVALAKAAEKEAPAAS